MTRFTVKPLKQIVWILIVVLLAGCGVLPSDDGSPTSAAAGAILFQDDFSHVPSGWGTWDRKGGTVSYENGGLRILVEETNFDFWSVAGRQYEDAVIEADATRSGGPEDNDFGLICRYQDNRNFYMFIISSDGYYGIVKLKDDQHSLIGAEQLQFSDKISLSQPTHKLRAECSGDLLKFSVDGIPLIEAHDSDFKKGDIGVMAGAYAQPGVDVLFDNVMVTQP